MLVVKQVVCTAYALYVHSNRKEQSGFAKKAQINKFFNIPFQLTS